MEHCLLGVFFVLDYQVNDLSDMSGFVGGTINIVDWDCSRQLSPYVLQPYKFNIDEHSNGSRVNESFNEHGGVAVYGTEA